MNYRNKPTIYSTPREQKRVCYIRSVPEWYGHHVNDIFFRQPKWLFVPLDELSSEERIREYKKSTYFFISGYGNPQTAEEASCHGCILIGPRCDVSQKLKVIEIKEWDNMGAYQTLVITDLLNRRMLRKNCITTTLIRLVRLYLYINYILKTIVEIYKLQGPRAVYKRIANFFLKRLHILQNQK